MLNPDDDLAVEDCETIDVNSLAVQYSAAVTAEVEQNQVGIHSINSGSFYMQRRLLFVCSKRQRTWTRLTLFILDSFISSKLFFLEVQ